MNADFLSGERRLPACFCRQRIANANCPGSARVSRAGEDVSSSRTFRLRAEFKRSVGSTKDCFGETPNPTREMRALPGMIRVYSRALAAVFVRPTRPPLHHRALRGRCARIFLGASKVWIKIGTEKSRRWEFRRSDRNSTLDISY